MSKTTRTRKAKREQARKRRQQMILLGSIVVVAVVAIVLVVLANRPLPADVSLDPEQYAGIERGETADGLPRLGSPDAPVVIADYSSFTCGHCANFHDNQFQLLLDDVRAGKASFVYVPVAFDSAASDASKAAYCAQQQGMFWEMHDTLFSWYRQYGPNSAYARSRITAGAGELGMDTNAFSACLSASATAAQAQSYNDMFEQLQSEYSQVTGTPTLTFNGEPPDFGSGGPPIDYIRQRITELSG